MGLMDLRHKILMSQDADLPPWYQRVEYIRAKSAAYLPTNYVPTRYDEFEAEFTMESISGHQCLFSSGTGTYQLVILLGLNTSNSYYRYFSSSAPAYAFNIPPNTWVKAYSSANGTMTINGYSQTYSYMNEIDGNDKNMYIFRRRNANSPLVGKLKYFKVINNGELKLNLIPCIRLSDNIAGAYDTVSKTFYGSGSSTELWTPSTLDT